MRAIGALVAVIVLSSAPVGADTTTDNKQLADKLFLEGRELLEKDPKAACEKFLAAQEAEKQNVAILLNLGLCHEKQNKNASALKWYRRTQQVASEKADPTLKEYEDAAKERNQDLSNGKVSKITFSLGSLQPNAEILLNGTTIDKNALIVEVDQGTAVIEARAPGMKTSRNELAVADNNQSLTYTFAALDVAPISSASRGKRRLTGILIGSGVILATTTVSGLWAKSIKDDFDDPMFTGNRDNLSQTKPTIVFSAGLAVGLGVAAYFWFTQPKRETEQTAFTPVITGDQIGASVVGRF